MRLLKPASIAAALLIGSVSGALAQVTGPSTPNRPTSCPLSQTGTWHLC